MREIIAAVSQNGVMGRHGRLPWSLPNDLKYFKKHTMGKTLLMGRKTFESLPGLLPGRSHVVLTRQKDWHHPGVHIVHTWSDWLREAPPSWCVIGGRDVYALAMPYVDRVYLTRVCAHVEGDVYFPKWCPSEWEAEHLSSHPKDASHEHAFEFWCYKARREK